MKKQYLEVGKIVATQGLKGELRVQAFSDTPDFLLDFEHMYYKNKQGEYIDTDIEYSRVQKNIVIIKFNGVESVEDGQKWRGVMLYINRDDVELDENTFFIQDLFGLKVINSEDNTICYGEIVDVTETGANDVYHIKNSNGEITLIPAIAKIVIKTDVEAGIMEIKPMPGLFDDFEEIR